MIQTEISTGSYPTGEGLTYEKIWAMFEETDRRMKETDRRMKETDLMMKETALRMKETDRKIGEMCNRFGELAEHLVAPGIAQRFNELGHHFNGVAPGGYTIKDEKTGKELAEIDILLENGDCIMAVEVKTRPRMQDIEHHIKRQEILRKHLEKKQDRRKIYGAIAGAVYGEEVKEATLQAGFYVLEQSGDTMKLDIPENFSPREW